MQGMKVATIVFFFCGLFSPFWPISLPVCWYLAYKSYKG